MLKWLLFTALAVLASLLLELIVVRIVLRIVDSHPLVQRLVRQLRAPVRLLGSVIVVAVSFRHLNDVSADVRDDIEHLIVLAVIGALSWFLARLVGGLVQEAIDKLPLQQADNLRARTVQTQLMIIRRIATVVVVVLAVATALWTFSRVRALGASILASAGIVGIIAGVSARSTIGNVIAGLQIAFAAPIRLDDVVVVEGQWGRVEEITLSQVVVRTWDQRRLILPCLYFVETPFENWTRPSANLLAPVTLELDPTVDVDDIRRCVTDHVATHPLWDGRQNTVQVIDAAPASVTVRVLLSARNASDAFDLRCDVREQLLRHLRDHQPRALSRVRVVPDPVG